MPITPTDAEVIVAAIESALLDVHVMLPGRVAKYNSATQTATVELQVKRVLPQGNRFATEDLPVLENVPVAFMRTNEFMITVPVKEGTTGMVIFSEMSLDQWRSKGTNTSPGDIGRHTLTGGVFQPGLSPVAQTILPATLGGDDIGEDLVMGSIGGGQLRVKPSGTVEAVAGGTGGQSADGFVSMALKTKAGLQTIVDAITNAATGGSDGGAAYKTNMIALLTDPVASVASSNLKAND